MKGSRNLLLTASTLALIALAVIWYGQRRTSPGDLAVEHARIPELARASASSCDACHGSGGQDLDGACLACHESVAGQIADGSGLHGTRSELASGCAGCHGEHHGATFQLVSERSFREAGIADVDGFAHEGLSFDLHGVHPELECTACHRHASARPLPVDARRFGGLSTRCASCHEDPHEGTYGEGCASCHGEREPFPDIAGFAHTELCPLSGSHAEVDCQTCHQDGSATSVLALVDVTRADTPGRECAACHDSPHRPAFLDAVAAELAVDAVNATCRTCHAVPHPGFADADLDASAAHHGASGFALHAPHAGLACSDCHDADAIRRADGRPFAATPWTTTGRAEVIAEFLGRFPGRAADDCAACHVDPHVDQLDAEWRGACLDCHARDAFHPTTFDVDEHARTAFPLAGLHADTSCEACHVVPDGRPARAADGRLTRMLSGTPTDCASCHGNAHGSDFLAAVDSHLPAADARSSCEACHDPRRPFLGEPPLGDDDWHAATGFALDAPHADLTCAACHESMETSAGPGWLADGAPRLPARHPDACARCHADPHDGQFAGSRGGVDACLRCHARDGFRPAQFDANAHADTRFALTGAHAAVGCDRCHPSQGDTATLFAGTPTHCSGCHTDVHGGAFDAPHLPRQVEGDTGCARCHDATRFAPAARAFDHGLWTDWPLDGAHANAACAGCHSSTRDAGLDALDFATVRGTRCDDCHGDPHVAQFAQAGRTDCARCHDATPGFVATRFDHDASAWPLDATHATVACSACHLTRTVPGGGSAVHYKPLGTACADCHGWERR